MADEKNTQEDFNEESNVDQINGLVSDSGSVDISSEKADEVAVVEEKTSDEPKHRAKEKVEDKPVKEHVVHHKKEKPVHHKEKDNSHKTEKVEQVETKKIHKKVVHKLIEKIKPKKIQAKPVVKKVEIIKNKTPAKKKEGPKDSDSKNWLIWTAIGILVIILTVAVIFIAKNNSKQIDPLTGTNQTNNGVAATVNGDPVYMKDVMSDYNKMNPMMQKVYTVDYILNKSIDDLLLYQYAKEQGISVKSDEVTVEINNIKKQNMLSDEELNSALKKQGITLDELKTLIEKNLVIRKLLNSTILQEITVTSGDINNYYTLNIENFKTPEKVTVQHILVQITDNFTDAQAKAKIDIVEKELNDTNFCDLVAKYSEDPGSLAICGKYTFAKGDFNNPEFENPSFSMNIGEHSIVKTVFGYHIIKKLEALPAGIQNLSEVKDQINTTVHDQMAQDKFDNLLINLRTKAVVVNYLTKTKESTTTTPVVKTEPKNLDILAKCLTANGAKMYGAYWCPHCNNQKDLFGSSLQYITYVECAVKDQPQVQTQECTDAGVSGYPTWIINGKQYPGEQTLEKLADLTGCIAP